jgi:hypothetical protein
MNGMGNRIIGITFRAWALPEWVPLVEVLQEQAKVQVQVQALVPALLRWLDLGSTAVRAALILGPPCSFLRLRLFRQYTIP